MSDVSELSAKLEHLGFAEPKIKEVLKNKKVAASFNDILNVVSVGKDEKRAALLHNLASSSKDAKDEAVVKKRNEVAAAIADSRIKTNVQLDAAWKWAQDLHSGESLDQAAGVGIEVTRDDVSREIAAYIAANKASLEEERYKALPGVMVAAKKIPALKWANPADFKPVIDEQLKELLGPKDERDLVKKKAPKAAKPAAGKEAKKEEPEKVSATAMFTSGFLGNLHKVGENPQANMERMVEHLKATKGQVFTRFPPEPNGYLHIGHSKAITVNFGYAQFNKGKCYLRFDDTNPEAEEERFFTSIRETIEWLGFEPYKVTYSSDYFQELYDLAEKLIESGGAFVCHQTAEEMKASRGVSEGSRGGERVPSPWRNRTVEENLVEFRKMRDGHYKPGEAVLRMKQDLDNPNPQMWDLVAYRVLNAPHHRTADKWKIYPTYDFTHCLVDSLENISHSLCTTEFYLSRESYEWLCDAVDVYRPAQREYGRLNITGTVLSKRKIAKLVSEGHVRGWDDPRLFTLVAIRRRGIPPGAILNFVSTLGVTTAESNIQHSRFENNVRKYLEDTTPRLMMVLDPVKVTIENLPEDHFEEFDMPFGKNDERSRKVPFTRELYIDRSDFEESAGKEFFRLTATQPVGLLKVPHNISLKEVKKDASGNITELVCHLDNDVPFKKPKTYIQWVPECAAKKSPVKIAETRVFKQLFKSENPQGHPDGYLADLAEESEIIHKHALVEPGFYDVQANSPWVTGEHTGKEKKGSPESVRFQALRVGYFCMDKDSTDKDIVLNQIVSLKEDNQKK